MPIQFHTYRSPQDDPGKEVIDKAIWKLRAPRIKQVGDTWVAEPIGDVFKSRAKFRSGKEPEEKDVRILDRFTPNENGDPLARRNLQMPLEMGNNVKDFQRQIEECALALILLDPAQAGSVRVND